MENLEVKQENSEIEEVKLDDVEEIKEENPSLVKDYFAPESDLATKELASLFGQSEFELQKEFGTYKAKKIYKRLNLFIDDNYLHKDAVIGKLRLAVKYGFYGVTVYPLLIPIAKSVLKGSGVKVRALVGFPHGGDMYKVIKYSLKQAVELGADEIIIAVSSYDIKNGELKEIAKKYKKLLKYSRKKPISLSFDANSLSLAELESGVSALSTIDISAVSVNMHSGIDKHLIECIVSAVSSREKVEFSSDVCSAEDAVSILLGGVNLLSTPLCEEVVLDLNKKINVSCCQPSETLDNNP